MSSKKLTTCENIELIELYLQENYELRYNVLSKKVEVLDRNVSNNYRHLTDKVLNSIIRQARKDLGDVKEVKQHVQEYLNSEDIKEYDPIRDWLGHLPKWDGQYRVAELFSRIPGIGSEQVYWCSIWLRSAVAHWLGIDTLHGNECVPTLIGQQGCGKSTFCLKLLPPHLRMYYLDHFNLANKFDKEMALTNSLLVNIDELDQIRPSRQAELKQALSKTKVNGRPIFGREQQDRVRYASFIATTNNPHPLQDPTGSRRYICIRIPEGMEINKETPVEYEQLYAQLVYEVTNQENPLRYWFTTEETVSIQQANAQFQQEQSLEIMLEACFRLPDEKENAKMVPVKQIVSILQSQYPQLQNSRSLTIQIGLRLAEQGYMRKMIHGCSYYNVVPRYAA